MAKDYGLPVVRSFFEYQGFENDLLVNRKPVERL